MRSFLVVLDRHASSKMSTSSLVCSDFGKDVRLSAQDPRSGATSAAATRFH